MATRGEIIGLAGQGGREAAFVDQLLRDPDVASCSVFPDNGLMVATASKPVLIHPGVKTTDVDAMVAGAQREGNTMFLTIQDNAVYAGVTDAMERAGIACPSPS